MVNKSAINIILNLIICYSLFSGPPTEVRTTRKRSKQICLPPWVSCSTNI